MLATQPEQGISHHSHQRDSPARPAIPDSPHQLPARLSLQAAASPLMPIESNSPQTSQPAHTAAGGTPADSDLQSHAISPSFSPPSEPQADAMANILLAPSSKRAAVGENVATPPAKPPAPAGESGPLTPAASFYLKVRHRMIAWHHAIQPSCSTILTESVFFAFCVFRCINIRACTSLPALAVSRVAEPALHVFQSGGSWCQHKDNRARRLLGTMISMGFQHDSI